MTVKRATAASVASTSSPQVDFASFCGISVLALSAGTFIPLSSRTRLRARPASGVLFVYRAAQRANASVR
jgi:hypothetical protein